MELGSSSVNVGILTSDALYTSISNALTSLCPTATDACTTDTVTINGISYLEPDIENELLLKTDGVLEVKVDSSHYNVSSLRDAIIKSAAISAQYAATGNSQCQSLDYTDYMRKRWWYPAVRLIRRQLFSSDYTPTKQKVTFCNSVNFAGAHYYAPGVSVLNIGSATDMIDTT